MVGPTVLGMAKSSGKPAYRCGECGWQTLKWVGRCGECQAWGTVEEIGAGKSGSGVGRRAVSAGPVSSPALPIPEVNVEAARAHPTGIDELDRVLGGGLVPGAVLLLGGEPGVGKSTLLIETAAMCAKDQPVLYVSGEESAAQVRLRADRVGAVSDSLYLASEVDLGALMSHVDDVEPGLLVVDSVQAIGSPEADGVPGGVTQVREVAATLVRLAKERGLTIVLVGHVTKDGSIAGPRVLEHLVDVVLQFEGERHSRLRMVRAVKNRFGPTDEIGCFDLADEGIVGVPDPSGIFVTRRAEPVPGTCITVTLEGRRPLVAEVQALVAQTNLATPRRVGSGLDPSRVSMLMAVLERRAKVRLANADVYTAPVGGVRLTEPSVDLAVALAVASSVSDLALPPNLVAFGEVGLGGEIRRVHGMQRRLVEAARLGFTRAVVPADPGELPSGVTAIEADDLTGALRSALGESSR